MTPIAKVSISDLVKGFDQLEAAVSPAGVAATVRHRRMQQLELAMRATLDPMELAQARTEFEQAWARAERVGSENRRKLEAEVREAAERGWAQVVHSTGLWAVAQHTNTVWVGIGRDISDLVAAVTARPIAQRQAEMLSADRALAAVTKAMVPEAEPAVRPLWYWLFVKLAGAIRLRDVEGCKETAEQWSCRGLRDVLLNFPDDPAARAAYRFQLAAAPAIARLTRLQTALDFEDRIAAINARRSAEDQIRLPLTADLFYRLIVDGSLRRMLAQADWSPNALNQLAAGAERLLQALAKERPRNAPPPTMWEDPLFEDWEEVDPMIDCTLVMLMSGGAEDLLARDADLVNALEELSQRTEVRTGERAASALKRMKVTDGRRTPPKWWPDPEAEMQPRIW